MEHIKNSESGLFGETDFRVLGGIIYVFIYGSVVSQQNRIAQFFPFPRKPRFNV